MKKTLITVCSILITTSSFAAKSLPPIKGIDLNKDGVMSEMEYAGGISKWFMKADANNDGYLVESECSPEVMKRADRNRDHKVSLMEHLMSHTQSITKSWEQNGKGLLNASK